jgi:hypothetical protein
MAVSNSGNRSELLGLAAGVLLAMLLALLVVNGGHNGQPSALRGPGNPMQTHQGR